MDAQPIYSDMNPDRLALPRLRQVSINPAATRYVQERLGRTIRHCRRMKELTLQDLAGACGVTFQQVHKYESGLCSLSASQLWAIARALDVPVSYFYDALDATDVWGADAA